MNKILYIFLFLIISTISLSSEKKVNEAYLLEPKLSNLVQILEEKIINKKDHFRTERSNYVIQNFSWEIVVQKLFKKFEEKLKK